MRRLYLLVVVMLTLLGVVAMGGSGRTAAQDATPADDFAPEGVSFEFLALGETEEGDLVLLRVTFEPGASLPGDDQDSSTALVYVESGTMTAQVESPISITRAGAFDPAFASPEADEEGLPASEDIPAGQEFQLSAGDSFVFPPYIAGELRNDGSEPAVLLVSLVGSAEGSATPEA